MKRADACKRAQENANSTGETQLVMIYPYNPADDDFFVVGLGESLTKHRSAMICASFYPEEQKSPVMGKP